MKTMNEEKVMSLAKENIEIDGVMRTRSVMMTVILTMIQEKVMSLAKEKIEAEQQAAVLKKEVENVKVLI